MSENKNNKKINENDSKKEKWDEITSQKRHNNFVNIKSGAWKKEFLSKLNFIDIT